MGKITRTLQSTLRNCCSFFQSRFYLASGGYERYSPSFYHFKPHKTINLSGARMGGGGGGGGGGGSGGTAGGNNQGSLYKEARPDSPYFRAGNSYTGENIITVAIHFKTLSHNVTV